MGGAPNSGVGEGGLSLVTLQLGRETKRATVNKRTTVLGVRKPYFHTSNWYAPIRVDSDTKRWHANGNQKEADSLFARGVWHFGFPS